MCLAGFLALAFWHGLIDDRKRRAEALIKYHGRGLERLAGEWEHKQTTARVTCRTGMRSPVTWLVGPAGLCRPNATGSPAGRRVLADWLLPMTPSAI